MAGKGNRRVIIVESAESSYRYHTSKNKMNTSDKLEVRKYDPILRKHVVFKEIKSSS